MSDFSIVVGKAVCIFIEHKCGFEFYSIDNSVYVNTFLTFIIAVIMCCVINIIQWSKRSRGQSYRVRKYKKPRIRSKSINKDNYICYIKGLCSRTEQSRIYLQGYLAY